jgi:hypothetical protein
LARPTKSVHFPSRISRGQISGLVLWQPGANSQSALRAAGPRSGSKPAHRSPRRNGGNDFPQTVLCLSSLGGSPLAGCRCCWGRPPVSWWAVSLLWRSPRPKLGDPRQRVRRDGAGTGWTETGPATFLDPGGREPRSAAERLLALETKFLLFWVGQKRDSVLSLSPAPRSDCSSGLRERNLPVAALWPSPNKRHAR